MFGPSVVPEFFWTIAPACFFLGLDFSPMGRKGLKRRFKFVFSPMAEQVFRHSG